MHIAEELSQILSSRDNIAAAWLFGSRARGTAREDSDVDVGVLFMSVPYGLERFSLEGQLEAVVGLPLQVVVMNDAPVDLIIRVLREGILLAENDKSARVDFEVKKRNEFWDLERTLNMIRRAG